MGKITKEQWKKIEDELTGIFAYVTFRFKGHKIVVKRVMESESKSCLEVYINDVIKGEWCRVIDELPDDAPNILIDVWCKKTQSYYSTKDIKEIEKLWGKRKAKAQYPKLHEKFIYIIPHFSKASVLCRQYQKLEGLEWIEEDGYVTA